ncbi:AEC family transporter [Tahibacter harae]|uniref:AEC family transporter n=1 Tax=Tahibacter harae TaxID=2963937 RepID=A0ABT1QU69_9GAMM|nr:AEC family transporter [Tahibacter harae]MCQ4165833.1 AEC family transporter [Tahibacter harae]
MSVLASFAFVLLLMGLGRSLVWRRLVPDSAPDALNSVVLYVCMPASILLQVPRLEFQATAFGVVLIPWLLVAVSTGLMLLAARLWRLARPDTAVLLLEVPLGNTSFLGYALVPVLASQDALPFAVLYDQFGSFLILSTFGLTVIAIYSGGARPTPAAVLGRVLRFPPFLALVFALTLMPAQPPEAIRNVLQQLAGAMLPLVGLALGMQLKLRLPRAQLLPLGLGLAGKLLLLPLLAWLLCLALQLAPDARAAVVLESGMPPMITAAALAAMARLAPELGAALVGYGVVLSMLTLPLWRWWLGL